VEGWKAMTESCSSVDRTAQTNEIYQALGQFFVEFSRMVSAMEGGLYSITGGDQGMIRAIVAELTADPLTRAWRSVIVQGTDLSENDRKVLSDLVAEISNLINLRNDWAHGTWFVGYGNEQTTDWSKASIMRFKNSAKGLARPGKLESLPTAEYILKVARHVALIADAIFVYGLIVSARRVGSLPNAHPSDRVRISKLSGHRQVQVLSNGFDWRSSEMP
jgi:hypothetical protein